MRRVVVDMQNALFADAIATALQKFDSGFEATDEIRNALEQGMKLLYT